jgi:hypothetical protein
MSMLRGAILAGVTVCVSSEVLAQPISAPVLKWQRGGCTSFCQTGWYSSPAVADLDGDGQAEVVWGSYDVVVLNGATGALRARATNASRVWPGIALADLTGDGTQEIVVGRSANQLHAYRFQPPSTLATVWARNPFVNNCPANPTPACEVRTLAVEDLESDGQLDVIAGRASGGATEQLNAYDGNGNQRPGWPARRNGEQGSGWGMYNENVTVGDLNGDGLKEVIGPTDTHYITALNRNGDQLGTSAIYNTFNPQGPKTWARVGVHVDHAVDLRGFANCGTEHRPNFANSAPAIADVNGDGTPEIIVIGNVYNCGTDPYTDLYYMPFIFRMDRTRWSGSGFDWTVLPPPGPGSAPLPGSQDFGIIQMTAANAVVADLDGDGRKEILFPSYDGKLHAYWLDKTEHGSWPHTVPAGGPGDEFRLAGEPAVADLNGDGQAEVLFTSWPKNGGNRIGHLHILSAQGVQLHRVALPAPFGDDWNGGLAAPTLANLDADADLEVVVGTTASGAVAYDLPGTSSARILWGTGRGNQKRTGAVTTPLLSVGDVSVVEGNAGTTNAVFTLSLSAPTNQAVTVNFATANGSATAPADYTAQSGSRTFAPGAVSQTVAVPVVGETGVEPNETFTLTLSGAAGAVLQDAQGVATILNDDVPAASVGDAIVTEGDAGSQNLGFTVSLSQASPVAASVGYLAAAGTATAGVDFGTVAGTLSFPPGTTTQQVWVPILGDTINENSETFFVNLSAPVAATVADGQGQGTILDNDASGLTISDAVVRERVAPNTAVATFTVTLAPPGTATVSWATADGTATAGSDYVTGGGPLSFSPGSSTQVVTVAVNADALVEGLETFVVDLSGASGATIAHGTGTARVLDPPGGGDFNGDGRNDLLWRHDVSGENVLWYMNGATLVSGTFTTPPTLADVRWKMVGTNDFNADGRPDVLWRHATSGENVLWYMNGSVLASGTFLTPSALTDTRWGMAGTGDFNLDGRPDILWRHSTSGEIVAWFMNGSVLQSGTFLTPPAFTDVLWQTVGTGDFNGDGTTDVLWRHAASGQNVAWFLEGTSLRSGAFTNPPALADPGWRMVATGDYNLDGRVDIVWRHSTSGQNVLWFMNGIDLISGTFTTPPTLPDNSWKIVGPR